MPHLASRRLSPRPASLLGRPRPAACRRAALCLAAAALLAACGDARGGGERGGAGVAGRYQLHHTLRSALPAVLAQEEGCLVQLTGGTLVLQPDSQYSSVLLIERACAPDAAYTDTLIRDSSAGRFRLQDDSIHFTYPTGTAAGAGLAGGDSLSVTGPLHTLIYRRQPR